MKHRRGEKSPTGALIATILCLLVGLIFFHGSAAWVIGPALNWLYLGISTRGRKP